jgi:hypothetical protein
MLLRLLALCSYQQRLWELLGFQSGLGWQGELVTYQSGAHGLPWHNECLFQRQQYRQLLVLLMQLEPTRKLWKLLVLCSYQRQPLGLLEYLSTLGLLMAL